ncbi:MAG: cytochrome c3 family protein [Bryobacteraceae bacterium]|jgi:hypothetical protein
MKIGKIAAIAGLVLAAGLLAVPTASFIYEAGAPGACARCHEMAQPVAQWAASTHRHVTCAECHGSALTTDAQFHMTNAHRVFEHNFGEVAERAGLRTADVFAILARCEKCHAREYASWSAGPHAVHYAPVFLDRKTNGQRRLMDDCLRCHGMHYAGGIRDLVTPLDNRGPWIFRDTSIGGRPAIPCLACHAIHQAGEPSQPHVDRAGVPRQEAVMTPSLALWDRRTGVAMPAALLPLPGMIDAGRAVKVSPDPRQALCYQCHAPLANLQVRSGDDRTPVGVHEGLSCLACHDKHRQTTRASCANCHPRLSNCGRDVETMDTTFFNKGSRHNVHFVKCADCHTHGIPPRKNRERAD